MNAVSRPWALVIGIAALVGISFGGPSSIEANSPKIVSVEEHWEMAIGEPDPQVSAPQATMVMSPHADLDSQYFLFTLSHRSIPEFQAGGLQVQFGNDAEVVTDSVAAAPLEQSNDVADWVQRLSVRLGW